MGPRLQPMGLLVLRSLDPGLTVSPMRCPLRRLAGRASLLQREDSVDDQLKDGNQPVGVLLILAKPRRTLDDDRVDRIPLRARQFTS